MDIPIVIAAFGTTTRALKTYECIDRQFKERFPGHEIVWAYSSRMVKDFIKKRRNIDLKHPHQVLAELFEKGYIAEKSGHSRGSTVDLTLIDFNTGKELDMGSPWDYFDEKSHGDYGKVSAQQRANRLLLNIVLTEFGFYAYAKEWWHFTLSLEPFPETFFDFVIK